MPRANQTTDDSNDAEFSGLVDAAMKIAEERTESLREIKRLLEKGDDQQALELMRKHLAVQPRLQKGNRHGTL